MSEPIHQKYDPDNFDPIVVKDRKSPWGPIVPICLTGAALWFIKIAEVRNRKVYEEPNVWFGHVGILRLGTSDLLVGLFFLLFAFIVALFLRRWGLAAIMILASVAYFNFRPKTEPDPAIRFKAEIHRYKEAIQFSQRYGDEYSEWMNGRTLIYWRWMTYDIDNAIGVVFDPADRLSKDADLRAFQEQSNGVIMRIRKMDPKWYIVEHG